MRQIKIYQYAGLFISVLTILKTSAQTAPRVSVQEVISNAVYDYKAKKYESAIEAFETGLVHYRMLRHIDINCGMRCNSPDISKELNLDLSEFEDLKIYGNILAQANCIKICKEEHPFTASNIERPSEAFISDFEKREPYNYLQFAYYQVGKVKDACKSAHTYLQANPHDEQMRENIAFYKGLEGVTDDYFVDLEGKPYTESFMNGINVYEDKNYMEAINHFEKALHNYFNVHSECTASCYVGKKPTSFFRFNQAIAASYIPALNCTLGCEAKLSPVFGNEPLEKFIAKVFSYLQFSYYQAGKWTMAVPAAASVQLLDPEDEVARSNYEYYVQHGVEHDLVPEIHHQPRADAVKYHVERTTNKEILALIKKATEHDDEGEIEDETELIDFQDEIVKEIAEQITVTLGEKLRGDIG